MVRVRDSVRDRATGIFACTVRASVIDSVEVTGMAACMVRVMVRVMHRVTGMSTCLTRVYDSGYC